MNNNNCNKKGSKCFSTYKIIHNQNIFAAICQHLFCCYQYNDLHTANTLRAIYFWQQSQIKTCIRPYVTAVSVTQSSTSFQCWPTPFNLPLFFMNNAKYITHWQQCLSPQFMFQQPHSTRDNLYLSMQALIYTFRGRRGGASVGIWYAWFE